MFGEVRYGWHGYVKENGVEKGIPSWHDKMKVMVFGFVTTRKRGGFKWGTSML